MNYVFKGAKTEPPHASRNTEEPLEGLIWARFMIYAQHYLVPEVPELLVYAEYELRCLSFEEFNLRGLLWYKENLMPLFHPGTEAKVKELQEKLKS